MFSQTQDTTKINEVIVKGKNQLRQLQKSSSPVNLIDSQEINRTDPTIITPVLNRIPGVYMQQGALNTNRITIRGVGARSQYSTNRLKAYLGNIPLTSANGETIIEDIDLELINQIKIIKGPNSTQFGSDIGGVIQLNPKDINSDRSFAGYSHLTGSYGLQKNSLQAGHKKDDHQLLVSYQNLQKEGYRDNSNYSRESFNIISELIAGDRTSLDFIGIVTDLKAFIPSSLSEDDFNNQPSNAAANWQAARGFESYTRGLFGMTLNQKITDNLDGKTSLFTNFKTSYEPRPFDILDENTQAIGFRTNFSWQLELWSKNATIDVGTEAKYEWYSTANYENLYQDFTEDGNVQGDLFFNVDQTRFYQNYFAEFIYELSRKLTIETGLSINATSFQIEDRFLNDGLDQTSEHSYDTAFNPRLGLNYEFDQNKFLYANVSRGFAVPTVAESLTPSGVLNTDLKPEKAWNYELGTKLNLFENKLYTEVNVYSLQVDNLLVARRTAEDQFIGINAGKTIHNGVETLLKANLKQDHLLWQPYFSGSFNFFEFDEFVDQETDYSGNDLTSVPDMTINLGLDLKWNKLQIYTNWNHVGEIPLNDANTLASDAYSLFNLKARYRIQLTHQIKLDFNAGINNLLNEDYAASILPNAIGFGGAQPRYYYPGLPRNYFAGARLNYVF
jgi:iron complex outermembrane receptor protein